MCAIIHSFYSTMHSCLGMTHVYRIYYLASLHWPEKLIESNVSAAIQVPSSGNECGRIYKQEIIIEMTDNDELKNKLGLASHSHIYGKQKRFLCLVSTKWYLLPATKYTRCAWQTITVHNDCRKALPYISCILSLFLTLPWDLCMCN